MISMYEITIHRHHIHRLVTDGTLFIEGEKLCDTAERTDLRLPAGRYQLILRRSAFYGRKVPTIIPEGAHRRINPLGLIGIGNGAYSLSYGHILVGTHCARGCVIQSRTALTNLYWRIEKALRRGLDVRLTIDET